MIHGLDTGFLVVAAAATYRQAGIQSVLTTNQADFLVFGASSCAAPRGSRTNPGMCWFI